MAETYTWSQVLRLHKTAPLDLQPAAVAAAQKELAERMERVMGLMLTGAALLHDECPRCYGTHVFGERCIDAAFRHARERGLLP